MLRKWHARLKQWKDRKPVLRTGQSMRSALQYLTGIPLTYWRGARYDRAITRADKARLPVRVTLAIMPSMSVI